MPLQFAYQAGKGVGDANIFIHDKIYEYLENPSLIPYCFTDLSPAFNTIQHHVLAEH